MINGNEAILYWNGEPIACLTSNTLSEALSFLSTSDRTPKGALSFLPVANSYAINFEAVMASDSAMSWDELTLLARKMELGQWDIMEDAGFGYLSNLDLVANSGENIIFTGTILGNGVIQSSPITWNIWAQSPSFNVDEGGRYVLVN
jgi:hypothetical protein